MPQRSRGSPVVDAGRSPIASSDGASSGITVIGSRVMPEATGGSIAVEGGSGIAAGVAIDFDSQSIAESGSVPWDSA